MANGAGSEGQHHGSPIGEGLLPCAHHRHRTTHRAQTPCCGQAQAGRHTTHHHHGHGGTGRHRGHRQAPRAQAGQPGNHGTPCYLPCCCPRTCQSTGRRTTSPSVLQTQEWSATVKLIGLAIALVFGRDGARDCRSSHLFSPHFDLPRPEPARNAQRRRSDCILCRFPPTLWVVSPGLKWFSLGNVGPVCGHKHRRVPKTKAMAKLSDLIVALHVLHGTRWSSCSLRACFPDRVLPAGGPAPGARCPVGSSRGGA